MGLLLAIPACGSLSTQSQTTLAKDSIIALEALQVLVKGVEKSADDKVISVKEAHQVLDIVKPAVQLIKASNTNAVETIKVVLADIQKLPFASKIEGLLFGLGLAAGAVKPTSAGLDAVAVTSLISTFLPGILAFIQRRREESGQDPTLEELKAHVLLSADELTADIDNWEALNPVPPDAPTS